MEEYYVFQGEAFIHARSPIWKWSLSKMPSQISTTRFRMCDWGPFTTLLSYIFYNWCGNSTAIRARKRLLQHKGRTDTLLCLPSVWPLDKAVQADGVITLDTKTDKDALAMKRAKSTKNKTSPPP
ncbi:hypothetical protein HAX54_013009 [Datura stramonium]|uniref:Uncharacterized protein n=1 Tax=Datura stramonium TaxID=4076 RepID=A0ABS8TKK7_DATST|nr:hypothetical protein [Datura stramonium]